MRIIDGEASLIEDLVDEIEVVATKQNATETVYAGIHPTLGRIVLMKRSNGDGIIVEVDA